MCLIKSKLKFALNHHGRIEKYVASITCIKQFSNQTHRLYTTKHYVTLFHGTYPNMHSLAQYQTAFNETSNHTRFCVACIDIWSFNHRVPDNVQRSCLVHLKKKNYRNSFVNHIQKQKWESRSDGERCISVIHIWPDVGESEIASEIWIW